jgi:hypothetical protein
MAPPISMHTVLVFQATKTIGVKAHCLEAAERRSWRWPACLRDHGWTPSCEKVVSTAFLAKFFDDLHWKSLLGR